MSPSTTKKLEQQWQGNQKPKETIKDLQNLVGHQIQISRANGWHLATVVGVSVEGEMATVRFDADVVRCIGFERSPWTLFMVSQPITYITPKSGDVETIKIKKLVYKTIKD